MPVLDTNFLVALRGGDPAAAALLTKLRGEELIVPDVVAVEFMTPLAGTDDREAALAILEQEFHVRHADRAWVLEAAAFRNALRRKGAMIRRVDFWIACWARVHGTFVVTRDGSDFAAFGVKTKS